MALSIATNSSEGLQTLAHRSSFFFETAHHQRRKRHWRVELKHLEYGDGECPKRSLPLPPFSVKLNAATAVPNQPQPRIDATIEQGTIGKHHPLFPQGLVV
jgi:hypothetical protein